MLTIAFAMVPTVHAVPIVNGISTDAVDAVGALVAIDEDGVTSAFCTATIIHPEWLITAGHCVTGLRRKVSQGFVIQFMRGPDIAVVESHMSVEIQETHLHPDYDIGAMQFDMGLVQLSEAIYADDIPTKATTSPGPHWSESPLYFVGYGVTGDGFNDSGIKREAYIDYYAYDEQFVYVLDPERQFNLCTGDSGGPAFRVQSEGSLELVGVNSFVFQLDETLSTNCIAGGAGASRVDQNIGWIEQYVPTQWEEPAEAVDLVVDESPSKGSGCHSLSLSNQLMAIGLSVLLACFRRKWFV